MLIQQKSKGFSLLEVLITLIILAVGLLGLAGLQAQSLRFNHFANMRGQASILAYAMSDRMRANRFAIISSTGNSVGYYNESDGTNYQAAADGGCSQATPSGTATTCTIPQMAANDRLEWNTDLSNYLAGGKGLVCIDATPTTIACDDKCINPATSAAATCATDFIVPYTITVMWDESGAGATGTGCDIDVSTDLKCFTTSFQVTP